MAKIGEPILWSELPSDLWRGSAPSPFLNDIIAKVIAMDYLHAIPVECVDKKERHNIQVGLHSRHRLDRKYNRVRGWRLHTVSRGLTLYVYRQPIEDMAMKEQNE